MKKGLFLIIVLVLGGILIGIGVERHLFTGKAHSSKVTSVQSVPPKPLPAVALPPALMTGGEWQKYRSARDSALQANPALQSEYKSILKAMDGQQTRLDAALVKADPHLAPVMAKLQALRIQNSVNHPIAKAPVENLTPEEWQELRTARTKAMQSNSDFVDEGKKLSDKMRVFEDSLDAAMLKANPSLAPIIAKFEAGRHPQGVAANSPHPK